MNCAVLPNFRRRRHLPSVKHVGARCRVRRSFCTIAAQLEPGTGGFSTQRIKQFVATLRYAIDGHIIRYRDKRAERLIGGNENDTIPCSLVRVTFHDSSLDKSATVARTECKRIEVTDSAISSDPRVRHGAELATCKNDRSMKARHKV
jgi:hypothetical protein